MPQRRTRKVSQSSDGHEEGQPSKEQKSMMLQRKKELFIQQFEKEAQARLNEMESNLQQLLATVDRAFKVLIMKTPQSLLSTLLKDAVADDDSIGEVTIAVGAQSPEMVKPLTRKPSKKGKVSDTATMKATQNKRATGGPEQKRSKTRSMDANDGKPLRCATTVSAKRTQSRFANLGDQTRPAPKARPISRSVSDDLSFGKVLPSNVAVITTSRGETLLLSEETKDDFNLAKVDDVAILHMERLRDLISHFCNKVKTI